MLKLSIIIVNFNSGDFLFNCLKSLDEVKDEAGINILVVDNASMDDSLEKAEGKFDNIIYIKNSQNLGFGRANNIALKKINSEYILLLNPDTQLKKGTISYMLSFMEENKDAGAATCRVLLSNGKIDLTAHRGFPTPWASFKYYFLKDDNLYHLKNRDFKNPHEVDAITGAFFLTRKSVLEKVGFFDEDYFLYGEDIDLCFRMKEKGFKVFYVPEVEILHNKGISSGLKRHSQSIATADIETRKKSLDAFYNAMKIFYRKHYEKVYPTIINWLVYLGINLKWWLAKRKMEV